MSGGRAWCEGCQVSTNATDSPAATVNSAWVPKSSPQVRTSGSLRNHTASGPAIATRWPSTRRIHGTTQP
jgi:hypothetical protein